MGDYSILMQYDIDADPAAVQAALATQDGIRAWWNANAELRDGRLYVSFADVPQPFEFDVRADDGQLEWVTGAFPPWWAGTTIRWRVGPHPDRPGTQLHFAHGGFEPDNPIVPIVTPAWAQILLRLKGYAETGATQPWFEG